MSACVCVSAVRLQRKESAAVTSALTSSLLLSPPPLDVAATQAAKLGRCRLNPLLMCSHCVQTYTVGQKVQTNFDVKKLMMAELNYIMLSWFGEENPVKQLYY